MNRGWVATRRQLYLRVDLRRRDGPTAVGLVPREAGENLLVRLVTVRRRLVLEILVVAPFEDLPVLPPELLLRLPVLLRQLDELLLCHRLEA